MFTLNQQNLLTTCRQYGQMLTLNNPMLLKVLEQQTTIPIYTVNKDGDENIYTTKNTDNLTSRVIASAIEIQSHVERKEGTNESLVVFKSHIHGMNCVQVKVNGEYIKNIPCVVYVYNPVKCPDMLAVTEDKMVVVGDSTKHVNTYSTKSWELISHFKLEVPEGKKNPGISTIDKFLYITDKINNSVSKYNFWSLLIICR